MHPGGYSTRRFRFGLAKHPRPLIPTERRRGPSQVAQQVACRRRCIRSSGSPGPARLRLFLRLAAASPLQAPFELIPAPGLSSSRRSSEKIIGRASSGGLAPGPSAPTRHLAAAILSFHSGFPRESEAVRACSRTPRAEGAASSSATFRCCLRRVWKSERAAQLWMLRLLTPISAATSTFVRPCPKSCAATL